MNNAKRCWKNNNQSLVQRGSITFWIQEDLLKTWKNKGLGKGRPSYSRGVIQAGLTLRTIYHLTLRQIQGFLDSILRLMGEEVKAPNYTLFCKRAKECAEGLPKLSSRLPTDLVIDSSGLKIFGEGEWKVHKHGREKRRGWIKIHVGVDPRTGECIVCEITDEKKVDASQLPILIKKAPKSIKRVIADGAYDTRSCRKALFKNGIEGVIPPRKNGRIANDEELEERNNGIREVKGLQGDLALWKLLKGYGKRSLVETYFSRLKSLYGDRLRSKKQRNQVAETLFRVHCLNQVTQAMA